MKQWMNYGGILIMGYTMYRNLSQCLRVKSKHQKKIFKESLVDPGLFIFPIFQNSLWEGVYRVKGIYW
jgi:hypothetical protein